MASGFEPIISVGLDKNGEVDFRIRGDYALLDKARHSEVQSMLIEAIATAEAGWRRKQEVQADIKGQA